MDRDIQIELDMECSAHIYNGRAAVGNKAKIPSFIDFNRKNIFIRSRSEAGCPFARNALEKVEKRINELNRRLISDIRVIESKRYDPLSQERIPDIEKKCIKVDVSKFDKTSLLLCSTLVLYDEKNRLLIIDGYRATGKVRKYQVNSVKFRKKIRGCMGLALQYVDHGYRGALSGVDRENKYYLEMVALYGEPSQETSVKTGVL